MKKILLIDDDLDDAELFKEALAEADSTAFLDYQDDGKKALRDLSENETALPHIIFLDINMPSISGWDCLKALKADNVLKKIPVIMYSTSSHKREMGIAADLGAADFIIKPHDYNELKEKLQEVISRF
ncbi:MAG: response regulator [Ferruginibacter sp.]